MVTEPWDFGPVGQGARVLVTKARVVRMANSCMFADGWGGCGLERGCVFGFLMKVCVCDFVFEFGMMGQRSNEEKGAGGLII